MAFPGLMNFFVLWMLAVHLQEISGRIEQQIHLIGYTTEQSSDNGGASSLAVDRNINTASQCTQTTQETDPWWSVDMQLNEAVTKVEIYFKQSMSAVVASDHEVYLSDDPFESATTKTLCGTHGSDYSEGAASTVACTNPTKGRYLTVQQKGASRTLTLCEVKAYGYRPHILSRVARDSKAGNNYTPVRDQYKSGAIIPSLETVLGPEFFSMDVNEKSLYKSPIVDCSWDRIQRVHMSVYTGTTENLYVDFDVSGDGDTRSSFYSTTYFFATSYHDLTASYFAQHCTEWGNFFNIDGQGTRGSLQHKRRFYINCYYGSCSSDVGWFVFFDYDHGDSCDWETVHNKLPVFKYSNSNVKTTAGTWPSADIFIFSAHLDDTFPGCEWEFESQVQTLHSYYFFFNKSLFKPAKTSIDAISNCDGIADGLYQSALACNIYVNCSSNSLTYKMCPSEKFFDKSTETCVTTSTTCTDTGEASSTCFPNVCTANPCGNSGQCTAGAGGFTCACTQGYSGDTCDTDECDAATYCQNGGTCTRNSIDSVTCNCPSGFNGDQCENNINDCVGDACSGNGICSDGINTYTCACNDHFTGTNCESEIGDCEPVDCNNGECEEIIGGTLCHCQDGYTGVHCQTNIDECESSPCGNNGNCSDHANAFDCTCNAGYSDDLCDVYDGCHDSPCQNDGTCTDADDSSSVQFTCNCVAGYVGLRCETQTICASNPPCQNGGTCVDVGTSGTEYQCECDSGYSGDLCNVYNGCHDNPCQNGGTCTDAEDSNSAQFTCGCGNGYMGLTCENETICVSNPPCEHGTCVDVGTSGTDYRCNCDSGYTGTNCDYAAEAGSADAQEGDQGISAIFSSATAMYGLIAAVGVALLVIVILICFLVAGKNRRKRQEEEEEKARAKSREAWNKKMSERQRKAEMDRGQRVMEEKATKKEQTVKKLEQNLFMDF